MSALTLGVRRTISALAVTAFFLVGSHTFAADIDVNADVNDIAIQGYDPVSYFTAGKPNQGSSKYTATFKGAIYRFVSAENRDSFRSNPAKFAPEFGGHCAYGVALGKKLDVDPLAWRVVDGKLYLNLNKEVQAQWSQDVKGNLQTANRLWPTIKSVSASEL